MKFIRKIKKKIEERRHPKPIAELKECTCENCEHQFHGHFCPNCGQEVAEFNRPFGFFLYDIFGNFFAFDTRLFKTFKYLLFRPGFITVEFFRGRRVRYSPPVRILVFLSFILFFLLQSLSEKSLEKSLDAQLFDTQTNTDSVSHLLTDSVLTPLNKDLIPDNQKNDSSFISITGSDEIPIEVTFDGNFRNSLLAVADQYEVEMKETQSPERRKELMTYITMCRMPELVVSKVLGLLSWAFFALVPLLGLILVLFYLKQKHRYIKHLIFSAHFHSFQFLVLIIISVFGLLFSSGIGWIVTLLLLTIPVYLVIAMKQFYGQRYKYVILKFLGVSILYQLMLLTAVVIVLVQSFGV